MRPRGPRHPDDDATFRERRAERRLRHEAAVRGVVWGLILVVNEVAGFGAGGPGNGAIRILALLGLILIGPVYLAARASEASPRQALLRMTVDIVMITLALYAAGGLAAAPYLGVYLIIPIYAGFVLSSGAAVVATLGATAAYLAVVLLQRAGGLTAPPMPPNAWSVAAFNLLLLNGVGGLTTLLARAYHQSQKRLAGLHEDLERAYDETSRLNTEIQRAARFHVLGEVVAGVTHEIGNALQGAILSVDLVRQKVAPARPDVTRNLEQIEYGCATAMRIVKNVLLTARQSSEEHLPVSLADVARRTVELKGYDLRRDGIVLQLDFARDLPLVVGSPFRLQQVLLNLVTNAQDALHNGTGPKAIAIVGSTDINQAVLEVRDTGPGIPPDVMPRLFEPFYTTKAQGTGLGLAISADIVRRLGGDLTARNRPEGGAVFRLTLPVARTAGPPVPAPQLAATPARADAEPPAD
ncbi:MAG: sensor histidine kinase [Candidatus Rokuibacteriota bacterium]